MNGSKSLQLVHEESKVMMLNNFLINTVHKN